jgi:hypothetical protein
MNHLLQLWRSVFRSFSHFSTLTHNYTRQVDNWTQIKNSEQTTAPQWFRRSTTANVIWLIKLSRDIQKVQKTTRNPTKNSKNLQNLKTCKCLASSSKIRHSGSTTYAYLGMLVGTGRSIEEKAVLSRAVTLRVRGVEAATSWQHNDVEKKFFSRVYGKGSE